MKERDKAKPPPATTTALHISVRRKEAVGWRLGREPGREPVEVPGVALVDGTSEDEPGLPQPSDALRGDEGLLLTSQGLS